MQTLSPDSIRLTTLETRPNKPLTAIILSVASPGMGHLYTGAPLAALFWGLAFMAVPISFRWLSNQAYPIGIALWLGLYLLVSAAAFRRCRTHSFISETPLQKWWSYLIFVLLFNFLGPATPLLNHQVQDNTMAKNFAMGEKAKVNQHAYGVVLAKGYFRTFKTEPKVGDVVWYRPLEKDASPDFKRVVAKAGDEVEFKSEALWINGTRELSPYAFLDPATAPNPLELKLRVPKGHLLLLADNRRLAKGQSKPKLLPLGNVMGRVIEL